MRDLVERTIARRAIQTTAVAPGLQCSRHALPPGAAAVGEGGTGRMPPVSNLRFTPVAPNNRDSVTVPQGFGHHVIIS